MGDKDYEADKAVAGSETGSSPEEVDAAWSQAEEDSESKVTPTEYFENQDYQAGQAAGSAEEVSLEDLGEAEEASQD